MQKCKLRNAVLVIFGILVLAACTSKTIEAPSIAPPTKDYKFSTDVLPLFTQHCATAGCHSAGNTPPDLSAANAYHSLVSNNLFDIQNPTQSDIYKVVTSSGSMNSHLPNSTDQLTILYWIQQGALNN
ncbi:MAG: hypothetical protein NTX61_06020 [Bacteroidetes bacterium]|nr:hypothetical protein [Bacteroidota bacterium]